VVSLPLAAPTFETAISLVGGSRAIDDLSIGDVVADVNYCRNWLSKAPLFSGAFLISKYIIRMKDGVRGYGKDKGHHN